MKVLLMGNQGYWGSKIESALITINEVYNTPIELRTRDIGDGKIHAPFETFLKETDAEHVIIATPIHTHYDLVKEFLFAGKNVFCEKPLCETHAQALELKALAEKQKKILRVDNIFQFTPEINYLKQEVNLHKGNLKSFRSERVNYGPFPSGTNVIYDLMPHDISIIQYLFGWDKLVRLRAISDKDQHEATVNFEFQDGFSCFSRVSWTATKKKRAWELRTSDNFYSYNADRPKEIELSKIQKTYLRLQSKINVESFTSPLVMILRSFLMECENKQEHIPYVNDADIQNVDILQEIDRLSRE